MSLLDKFRLPDAPAAQPWTPPAAPAWTPPPAVAYNDDAQAAVQGRPVTESGDWHRVLALPRRPRPTEAEFEALSARMTARLGKGDVACNCAALSHNTRRCARTLLPVQAWALSEIESQHGLLGPIGVGDGKTLLDILSPMVMPGCHNALLLVPAGLKPQLLKKDWDFYGQHWHLPNLPGSAWVTEGRPWLHVYSFHELSNKKATELLERINPDTIIVDEAQNLRDADTVRTDRFLKFMAKRANSGQRVRFCNWSGTLVSNSIEDYAHLSNLALGQGSPTPLSKGVVKEWAQAIDPPKSLEAVPTPPGALLKLGPEKGVRAVWRSRLRETPGVVASDDVDNCTAALYFHEREVTVPPEVEVKIQGIRNDWMRPDGDPIVEALKKAACARQMASGFFYRWRWPQIASDDLIDRWLLHRKAWRKELREKMEFRKPHLDSPALCTEAAIRYWDGIESALPKWPAATWQDWRKVFAEFKDLTGKRKPDTDPVWVDDFLVRDAAAWGKEHVGIIWYEHDAFGRKLAELSGFPFYGPGDEAAEKIVEERGDKTIIAAWRSHGTGKNLQYAFHKNYVVNLPSSGAIWEQLIGRTHRQGQRADEVNFWVPRHTSEVRDALDMAREKAAYIGGTMHGRQKLSKATYVGGF